MIHYLQQREGKAKRRVLVPQIIRNSVCEIICYRILQTSLLSYDANRAGYSTYLYLGRRS